MECGKRLWDIIHSGKSYDYLSDLHGCDPRDSLQHGQHLATANEFHEFQDHSEIMRGDESLYGKVPAGRTFDELHSLREESGEGKFLGLSDSMIENEIQRRRTIWFFYSPYMRTRQSMAVKIFDMIL